MYLNVSVNNEINVKIAPVSIAEMRAVQKSIYGLWKNLGVVEPVTSVPNTPEGLPGEPDVEYDANTGLFTFSIPVGAAGNKIFVG